MYAVCIHEMAQNLLEMLIFPQALYTTFEKQSIQPGTKDGGLNPWMQSRMCFMQITQQSGSIYTHYTVNYTAQNLIDMLICPQAVYAASEKQTTQSETKDGGLNPDCMNAKWTGVVNYAHYTVYTLYTANWFNLYTLYSELYTCMYNFTV